MTRPVRPILAAICVLAGMLVSPALQAGVVQTNLVSNIPGLAENTDPNLRNPWGISFAPGGPFWVSNQMSGNTTLYNGAGQPFPVPSPLVVTIPLPPGASGNSAPTGQVFNNTPDFVLSNGAPANFLFASIRGTISGWNFAAGTTALLGATTPRAVYTGLGIGQVGAASFLYAADVAGNKIDVFDGAFAPAAAFAGKFVDPNLPAGFLAFNIQNIGGKLLVTYEDPINGGGVVNAFDLEGNFLARVADNDASGPLQAPWGLAEVPAGFEYEGLEAGDLLVGNFATGTIAKFQINPDGTGDFSGLLRLKGDGPFTEPNLWGLIFGNGGIGGTQGVLFFASGINGQQDGLFGSLASVPEPSTGLLGLVGLGAGLAARAVVRRKRRADA